MRTPRYRFVGIHSGKPGWGSEGRVPIVIPGGTDYFTCPVGSVLLEVVLVLRTGANRKGALLEGQARITGPQQVAHDS